MNNKTVIPFHPPKATEPKCSFCGRVKSKVMALIQAQTGATICDRCIDHCLERLEADSQQQEVPA